MYPNLPCAIPRNASDRHTVCTSFASAKKPIGHKPTGHKPTSLRVRKRMDLVQSRSLHCTPHTAPPVALLIFTSFSRIWHKHPNHPPKLHPPAAVRSHWTCTTTLLYNATLPENDHSKRDTAECVIYLKFTCAWSPTGRCLRFTPMAASPFFPYTSTLASPPVLYSIF